MLWDLFAVYLLLTLAVAGWSLTPRKLLAVPVSVILATVIAHVLYVSLAAWLTEQLALSKFLGIFVSYLCLWLIAETMCETFFRKLFSRGGEMKQPRWQQYFGCLIGLTKGAMVVLFACLAAMYNQTIPEPRAYSEVGLWLTETSHDSIFLNSMVSGSSYVPAKVVSLIVSPDAPIIVARSKPAPSPAHSERAKQIHDLFATIRQLETEAGP